MCSFMNLAHTHGIARDKRATVADYLCWRDDSMSWDVTFLRPLQDWGAGVMAIFVDLLYPTKIRRDDAD
jgi:hypothetical protein